MGTGNENTGQERKRKEHTRMERKERCKGKERTANIVENMNRKTKTI